MFLRRSAKRSKHKAPKAPFSFKRQLVPPIVGLAVVALTFGLLNGQYLAAQAQYRLQKPVHTGARTVSAVNHTTAIDPGAPPTLTIPSLNVQAPIVLDEPSFTEWKVQLALRRGVVHYGQTALPGQKGNIVLLGHSSGQLWAPGDYKFVFTLLDKLKPGDLVHIDYHGTRYVYQMTDSTVVPPNDLSALEQSDKPTVTLITCTPVGTSKNRLVVHAKQISPAPDSDHIPGKINAPVTATKLPGSDTSVSLWQRVRNAL